MLQKCGSLLFVDGGDFGVLSLFMSKISLGLGGVSSGDLQYVKVVFCRDLYRHCH